MKTEISRKLMLHDAARAYKMNEIGWEECKRRMDEALAPGPKNFSDTQIDFIIKHFFIKYEYPGSESIARILLTGEPCTVSGNKCIWEGDPVSDFMTATESETIGCVNYTLDVHRFLKSPLFISTVELYISEINNKIATLKESLQDNRTTLVEIGSLLED